MTTARSAGAPALPVGSFVPSRSGCALSAFWWLVFALVDSWSPPTGGIIRTPVTRRRTRTGVVVPRILPIITTPAAREAAAELVKALVNALQAVRRAANLTLWLVVSMTPTFTGTLLAQAHPQPRSKAHQPHRSGAHATSGPRMARGTGSGPQHDQNRCPGREKVNPRSTSRWSAN